MKKTKIVYRVIRHKSAEEEEVYATHDNKRRAQYAIRFLNGLVKDTDGSMSGLYYSVREQEITTDDD